jgi:hypothetical protein
MQRDHIDNVPQSHGDDSNRDGDQDDHRPEERRIPGNDQPPDCELSLPSQRQRKRVNGV